jgi:putative component of membrane protein insertase Oxa1/YidC/SpoIIIJ protein YidD
VKRNANQTFFKLILQSHFILSGFVFLSACQMTSVQPSVQLSTIDQKFKLQKTQSKSETSWAVTVYRNVVAPTLSTQCKWYPSDSQFARGAQKRCGNLRGGVMAFSRFLYEEDASTMGYPFIINNNRIEFVDLPNECWF